MKKEISVTSKSGYTFPISIVVNEYADTYSLNIKAGGAYVNLEDSVSAAEGLPALFISSFYFKEAKAHLAEYIPPMESMKKANITIVVNHSEYERLKAEIEAIEAPIREKIQAANDARKAREAAQPRVYARWDFLDMGDYAINQEREILECREPLPEEMQTLKVVRTVASLWNDRIGEYGDEWKAIQGEKREVGNYVFPLVIISEAEARKWQARAEEADNAAAKAKEEKEAKRKAAEESRQADRAAKFAQAKKTGEKVLLDSFFISGSEIPRRFRDEDSDMGHLCQWAMPDGTVTETFSHSY